MLELAGSETDGVVTWMVGPRTLGEYIVPRVREAAERAGRPQPRVVAGILVCVTSDPDGARSAARERLALYGTLPAYRAMLEREGVSSPQDLLIAGEEARVRQGLEAYARAGATDVRVTELGRTDAERARTRELLEALLAESRAEQRLPNGVRS
jgi:5,10-methylenetetrahydromethanopterin reductase